MTRLSALLLAFLLAAESSAAPVSLFDGKTIDQWESVAPPIGGVPMWRVEDGLIAGGSLVETVPSNDFLATKRSFGNFELRLKIKISGTGFVNSGVQIRSQRAPKGGEMVGYQVDAGEGWWGKLYDESRRNKVIGEAVDLAAVATAVKKDDWNEYVIRAEGPRIRSWINGVAALDYTEADPAIPLEGRIGIQVHAGGKTFVQVKEITIDELAPPKPGEVFVGASASGGGVAQSGTEQTSAKVEPRSPEEELKTFSLAPGFEIELVAAEIPNLAGKFITVVFDQQGRMWTMTAFEYPVDANENKAVADALYGNPGKDKVLIYDNVFGSIPPGGLKPHVWAEGLAIPLGLLPYRNGAYVQHGPNIEFLSDTDGDGRADKKDVILTGFGVQDSHLFPHQFTRAPGGWIWMAQGAFNYSKVRQPNDPPERAIQFDQTRMAKFRPDGSGFDITSQGPCNIWGLVINGEGEAFIQEANDFGYPVMPFHEYANYPGCSDRQWKSYAPEFPGSAPNFRMGGTGLSGLALSDAKGAWPGAYADVMYVANPITRQIQAIKMHRDGPRWQLEKLPNFINCGDPMFRPVAITFGPDGCLYIVDWYNKIISHNEVARNHPDRDKVRGRIWRVKYKDQTPFKVPDFSKLSSDELIAKLGGESLAQSHLAWQALAERKDEESVPKLRAIVSNDRADSPRRIQALWALEERRAIDVKLLESLFHAVDRNIRREAIRAAASMPEVFWSVAGIGNTGRTSPGSASPNRASMLSSPLATMSNDDDPEVRAEVIRAVGQSMSFALAKTDSVASKAGMDLVGLLVSSAREPLAVPLAQSTQKNKAIKVREAYDREFERYLVRMFLEQHPSEVARFLDSAAAKDISVEARLLASLALEPKACASRVAKLLPQIQRAPEQEEVMRLAQFPDEPGVGDALREVLTNAATRSRVLEALLATRTRLDATKLTPMLTDAAKQLMRSKDGAANQLGVRLAGEFKLAALEPDLITLVRERSVQVLPVGSGEGAGVLLLRSAVRALAGIESTQSELFVNLVTESKDQETRDEAIGALASSKAPDAAERLLKLWTQLPPAGRRTAMDRLTSKKPGAKAVVKALRDGTIAKADLDGPTLDKLQTVLGVNDSDLAPLLTELASLFRPVLVLNGQDDAWSETGLTLEGPFTVECWVRLDPASGGRKAIDNNDGILGSPGLLDINFFDSKLRVWVGGGINDAVISKKPMTPEVWTHVAVTRDEKGFFKLFQDGELTADQSKSAPRKFEDVRIAWTQPGKGTAGALSEFRVWNRIRTPDEIRRDFDRTFDVNERPPGLVLHAFGGEGWGTLKAGAKILKTSDFPPVMSVAEAKAQDDKFAKFRALAQKPGDIGRGKTVVALCQACHLFKGQGASIGPDLSGVGAMGTEAILRNILTPNAAMENGYRIYRVELKSGDLVDAFFVSEDKDAVVVRLPGTPDRRIAKADIRSSKYLRRSLMPEGLLDGMSEQQVSDLFAFLLSMK